MAEYARLMAVIAVVLVAGSVVIAGDSAERSVARVLGFALSVAVFENAEEALGQAPRSVYGIEAPKQLDVNEAGEVRVSLRGAPLRDSDALQMPDETAGETNTVPTTIKMTATLVGPNFDVEPGLAGPQLVLLGKDTTWSWLVTPTSEDAEKLAWQLVVFLDVEEEELRRVVAEGSFAINVDQTPTQLFWGLLSNTGKIAAAIAGLGAAVGVIVKGVNGFRNRRATKDVNSAGDQLGDVRSETKEQTNDVMGPGPRDGQSATAPQPESRK